jgi:DNA-directed RNA polymerase I subunit RPA1
VPVLTTEGINVDEMFGLETFLDINKLFCNNIHVMARYYGIEAANRAIVKEITDVFEVKILHFQQFVKKS